jgi:hypothetical protein
VGHSSLLRGRGVVVAVGGERVGLDVKFGEGSLWMV